MLYILTGQIQIGKTRWLETLIAELSAAGIESYGVLAPGIWRELPSDSSKEPHREKLGINNVLLPSKEIILFARHADLARADGSHKKDSQSGKMGLAWSIDDKAIQCVNEHFAQIQDQSKTLRAKPGLLVVDELGRLELKAGQGLVTALELLESGPNALTPHAIIVVREDLLPLIEGRFERWGEKRVISPTLDVAKEILSLLTT